MSENSYFGRKNVSLGLYARHYIFVVGLKGLLRSCCHYFLSIGRIIVKGYAPV